MTTPAPAAAIRAPDIDMEWSTPLADTPGSSDNNVWSGTEPLWPTAESPDYLSTDTKLEPCMITTPQGLGNITDTWCSKMEEPATDLTSKTDLQGSNLSLLETKMSPKSEEVTHSPADVTSAQGERQQGECEDEPFDEIATKYELRPQSSKAGFTSTWIDHDETGDYDPSKEFRRPKTRRNKVKTRERDDVGSSFDSTDEDAVSGDTLQREQTATTVKLNFRSDAGKAAFTEHVNGLPAKAKHARDDFSTGYRLRKKAVTGYSHHGIAKHLDRPADAPDVPADLTGYPVARGCWGCLKLGISCPLLDDERAWPCVTCLEDDHDCELVTQPVRKRACERCKRKRTACSYTDSFDHSGPCEDCSNDGCRCVAGPLKESIITRIRYDRDWVKDPLISKKASKPKKTYWTCMQCREGGRVCSFSNGGTGEDCTTCELAGSICIPEKVVTPQHHKATPLSVSAPEKKIAARAPAEQETPTKKQKITTKPVATTKMITTKFCHPMIFNYEDTDGDQPCDFCATSNFAILGLGPKEVEVIEWSDNRGLTELGGGHMEDGAVSTKVCTPCTLQRVPIIMCQRHEMRPIPGVSLETLDVDGAFMALFSGEQRKTDRWCSICPSLATYECEAQGSADALGNPCDGCGLSLCEQCTVSLSGAYDGDLQAMLAEMEDEPSVRPLGLKADFELLRQDGLLMQYVLQQ